MKMAYLFFKRVTLAMAVAALGVSVLSSCSKKESGGTSDASSGTPGSVLVLSGGSMRAPLEKLIREYKKVSHDNIMASYGGSGELCSQIQNSGKGDIYICHDPFMPWAEKQGMVDKWFTVGHFKVVVVVPKDNPKHIKSIADLAKPGIRIGVGDMTYSTSGQVVKQLLSTVPYGDAIKKNMVSQTKGHQGRCSSVAMGALDAGFAWSPVAKLYADKLASIPIPEIDELDAITSATYKESDVRDIKVAVGLLKNGASNPAAKKFYAFLEERGKKVFAEMGF